MRLPIRIATTLQGRITACRREFGRALATTALVAASISAAHAADVHVLHTESIVIADAIGNKVDARKAMQREAAGRTTLRFAAYGRSFSLALEAHRKMNEFAAVRGGSALALRGKLEGVENSWIRLTQIGENWHGLIWDGAELYAVEPADAVSKTDGQGTVIFRLSDTSAPSGTHSCAVDEANATGTEYFEKLQTEIASEITSQGEKSATLSHRLLLSAIIDTAFRQQYPTDQAAIDALLVRLNNVDGIFSSQLGVAIELADVEPANSSAAQSLTSSSSANQLLTSLSQVRASDPNLLGTGITHLFTGRNLDGSTIGISYIGAVCSSSYGATLSEARERGAWIDSLIAAHELGHSFGAPHDGASECASTPPSFLMAPTIEGWDQFSQCSVDRIKARMTQAACLVPMPQADVIVAENLGNHQAAINQEFYWGMSIANLGEPVTQSVLVRIAVPPAIQVLSGSVSNGACSIGAGIAECTLSAMAPLEVRRIELRLRGTLVGTYDITADVGADSDLDHDNNRGYGTLVIAEPVPAGSSTPPPTATAPTTPAPPTEEGGGGGSFGGAFLLLLCLLVRRRP